MKYLSYILVASFFAFAAGFEDSLRAEIVINEIHYNPDVEAENVEFVELYNTAASAINVGGWRLTGGIDYVIPGGTMIQGQGYLVVCEDVPEFTAKFGFAALGPFAGRLNNDGDTVELLDTTGDRVDRVEYQLGFPWPTVGDEPGFSIELVHPSLDNNLAGSWRASVVGEFNPSGQVIFPNTTTWKYYKPFTEAPSAGSEWREIGFDDSGWLSDAAPFYYEDGSGYTGNTLLSDMRNGYSGVYMRKVFNVTDPSEISSLTVDVNSDDGCVVWINGTEVGRVNAPGGELAFDATTTSAGEPNSDSLTVVNFNLLQAGDNVVAVHALNQSLGGSSDFLIDVALSAQVGGSVGRGPTPGIRNSVYATNIPPHIRQVEHRPNQPKGGETVLITAKVTDDADGVGSVLLEYQLVDPGNYIEMDDAAYATSWTEVAMNDNGSGGDEVAGDDIYTAQLGSNIQVHRRLVRYRIVVADGLGNSVRVPYADDLQGNFVYFVYDGVPAWQGSVRPGVEPVVTYPAQEMGRLPVYHLISKRSEVEAATWGIGTGRYGGDEYRWAGTLVYDGKVYDHVHFRPRGGVWRFSMVKHMWKFLFNRGHEFEARDNWGRKFPTKWRRLNLGASIQQGDFNHRGEQGMFESTGFRFFDLAGTEAPLTTFISFRIVDEEEESFPGDQFNGDFWGVYLAIEQMDGRFLDAHGLPDGNLYKMENGTGPGNGAIKNQGFDSVGNSSDLTGFQSGVSGGTDQWWRDNFDLERYYSYYTIVQAIHHYDICCGKNYYFYFFPDTGKMAVLPWDLDLTWADNMYNAGDGGTDYIYDSGQIFSRPVFRMELGNRVREIMDLLWNEEQGYRLIDEYAGLLKGPNLVSILAADQAMWDYNPKMTDSTYSANPGNKAGQGRFYQFPGESATNSALRGSFDAGVQILKNYVTRRGNLVNYPAGTSLQTWATDSQIPSTPVIQSTSPGDYPVNRLSFRAANYSGPNGFAAWKWRIAEITPTNGPAYTPGEPHKYEIETTWESAEVTTMNSLDMTVPASAVRVGRRYRVRARAKDVTGRWSHWSAPIEFTSGEPDSAAALLASLEISELMFNSPAGSDFDFIELHNSSSTVTLDLGNAKVTQGIDYTFPMGTLMAPGAYLVLGKTNDVQVFRDYYGLDGSVPVLGGYEGNFSNGGEDVVLRTSVGGTDIVAFQYADGRGWP